MAFYLEKTAVGAEISFHMWALRKIFLPDFDVVILLHEYIQNGKISWLQSVVFLDTGPISITAFPWYKLEDS